MKFNTKFVKLYSFIYLFDLPLKLYRKTYPNCLGITLSIVLYLFLFYGSPVLCFILQIHTKFFFL